MPQTIKEKLIEILDKEMIFSLCGISNKTKNIVADKILSLIIEELPHTKDYKCTCGCNFKGACLCKEKRYGYNAYRKELIRMLKGV